MSDNKVQISILSKKVNKLLMFLSSILVFAIIYHKVCDASDFFSNIKEKERHTGLEPMQKFFDAIYFSTIVQSTVGYGDISPKNNKAKWLVVSQVMISFIILLL
tara:strand:+ start:118 stop:429 length:312 start_codon:yes stop_codon:yes gene_type:complete